MQLILSIMLYILKCATFIVHKSQYVLFILCTFLIPRSELKYYH